MVRSSRWFDVQWVMSCSTRQLTRFEIYWQVKGTMRAEATPYLMKKPKMEHMSRLRTCAAVNLGQWTTHALGRLERRRGAANPMPFRHRTIISAPKRCQGLTQRTRNLIASSDSYPKAVWRPP
jgi:hypothetical protein